MGRTWIKRSSELRIHLEGDEDCRSPPAFSPGDTIIGFVSRKVPTVSPRATVKITLCGRAKSKIVVSRGNNNSSTYRGRFAIINEDAFSQKIYDGPLHIEGTAQHVVHDPAVWPFAIDLPLHCDPKWISSLRQENSFLPLDAATVNATPLPNTFHMHHNGFGTNREGFIEYFLKADISFTHQGSSRHHEATMPFEIRSATTEPPITDFKLRRHRVLRTFSSFRLLPGMEDAELSFTQKRQQLFGSDKVPRIGGYMELDVPRLVQLDNPKPLHIQLRFVPDEKATSSNMQGILPKVKLVSMIMVITSHTTVRCPGSFSPHDESDQTETNLQVYPPLRSNAASSEPFYIPATEEWPPIDVGTRMGFRVPSCTGRTGLRIHPDFTTYNIKHWHNVRVTAVVLVGDRDLELSSVHPLRILPPYQAPVTATPAAGQPQGSLIQARLAEDVPPPPFQGRSESWIHPPAEGDAPPTFAQVKKEDEIRQQSHDGNREELVDTK